jgi:hypothetical protein
VAWALLPAEFALLAALIISKQPGNLIGWLLMLPAIALASDAFKLYFARFSAAPVALSPVALTALWFSTWTWLLLLFPIFFILLLFPTGSPVSPRWRWVSLYVLGVSIFFFVVIAFQKGISSPNSDWFVANPIGFIPMDWFEKYLIVPFAVGLLSTTVLCVISMIVRYRHTPAMEREQIKWLLYACGLFAATYILNILAYFNSQVWGTGPGWVYFLMPLGMMTIPAAIAIAILRYHLWDIDVIIRRTLVYGGLTATLALVFFGGVALLQEVIGRTSGTQNSPVAIVISTLTIAALFTPLRRRIQRDIDRRFYRKKYDAQKTLESFAATVRDEVELEQISVHLLAVIQETMQPEGVSLWLKPGKNLK